MLGLVQMVYEAVLEVEMRLDHRWRRKGQPLCQADILDEVYRATRVSERSYWSNKQLTRVPNLKELECAVTRVLDIVAVGGGDVCDVAGHVVEGDCVAVRCEDGHTALTLEEVGPFILSRVPVELPTAYGFSIEG